MNNEPKRILLMEDSDIFADMVISFLSRENYILERAVNGFDGIKKVYSFMPHLIITDIEMPLLKGYQVTRLLKSRKSTKDIPVIILTTLDQSKDKFWAKQAGADIFIEKSPDNFESLEDAVKECLSKENKIDFSVIERESKKINDNSIIEIVNNLLDNKLFQTTIIGLLTELSRNVHSLALVTEGIFNLLQTVCEAEIASIFIKGNNRNLYIYTANIQGFSKEISDNFNTINISDFKKYFPDYDYSNTNTIDFFPNKDNNKKLLSYISVPLTTAGDYFASINLANTLNDYFTPSIMENINVFLEAASPVIANALSIHELKELQNNTRTAFARYVPVDVMDEIINESFNKKRTSESRNTTILFSDIRDFTIISENNDAQSVVDFLNTYISKMGSEIIIEDGHIDKFIGDAIMAVFGAFGNTENSANNAICAAVRMLSALEQLKNSGDNIFQKLKIGIGIHYGECILGNIGFKNKMDYTVIGDTVNLASRIESLTKLYNHPLIISETVCDIVKDNFLCRKIDNVRVKGKEKSVGVFAVYSGYSGSENENLYGYCMDLPFVSSLLINQEMLANYNKGLNTFYMHEWKLAHEYFEKALECDNNDFLSGLYLERSINFINNPPPKTWDGVITIDEK